MNREEFIKKTFVTQDISYSTDVTAQEAFDLLNDISTEEIFNVIRSENKVEQLTKANITQYSSFEVIYDIIDILIRSGMTFNNYKSIGFYICDKNAKDGARAKYAENHCKLAIQLGLLNNRNEVSELGRLLYLIGDDSSRDIVASKLCMRIPIIQRALIESDKGIYYIEEAMMKVVAESTCDRRKSNIKKLIKMVRDVSELDMQLRINNIVWGIR